MTQDSKWLVVGETPAKWAPRRAAVVSYAQYHNLGQVLPLTYDETVLTRWGIDLSVAAPVISITATPARDRKCNSLSSHLSLGMFHLNYICYYLFSLVPFESK